MKNKWVLAGLLATVVTGTALAQPATDNSDWGTPSPMGGQRGPGGPGGKRPDPAAIFKELDANGDGFVSKAEMMKAHEDRFEARFKSMDANGDGKLTQAEMNEAHQKMRDKMRSRMKNWRDQRGQGNGGGQGKGWNAPATDAE